MNSRPKIQLTPEELEELKARSRSSLKKESKSNEDALFRLIDGLLKTGEKRWEKLVVPERIQDALRDALRIKHPAALARHYRHVRSMLREVDWMGIARRLDQLNSGQTPDEVGAADDRAILLAAQLMIQGDPGLARFMLDYPDADRSRLRLLIRSAQKAVEGKKAKARYLLEQAVAIALDQAQAAELAKAAALQEAYGLTGDLPSEEGSEAALESTQAEELDDEDSAEDEEAEAKAFDADEDLVGAGEDSAEGEDDELIRL